MAQEILYTSLPSGLRPGSYGFCTVAATAGMPGSLLERLESLSGYRHSHAPGDAANPVVVSHLLLKLGSRNLHVLSRVADAGLDYSHRSNKLAHHVALEITELPAGGPAWLAAQPRFLETTWSGEPRNLPPKHVPSGHSPPRICHAWQQATGDAGWGGVLAQHANDARRPAYIIVPPQVDPLPLLLETLALLPLRQRWDISFTTCFTKLPAGIDCLWRFVLAGSIEAQQALGLRGDLVLNLAAPLGTAPASPLVNSARSGVYFAPASLPESEPHPQGRVINPRVSPASAEGEYRLATSKPPDLKFAGQLGSSKPSMPPALPSHRRPKESGPSGKWRSVLAIAALLMMTVIGAVIGANWERIQGRSSEKVAKNTEKETDPTPIPTSDKPGVEEETNASNSEGPGTPPVEETTGEEVEEDEPREISPDSNPEMGDIQPTKNQTSGSDSGVEDKPETPLRVEKPITEDDFQKFPYLDYPLPKYEQISNATGADPGNGNELNQPHLIWELNSARIPDSLRILGADTEKDYFSTERVGDEWRIMISETHVATIRREAIASSSGKYETYFKWIEQDDKLGVEDAIKRCIMVVNFGGEEIVFLLGHPIQKQAVIKPAGHNFNGNISLSEIKNRGKIILAAVTIDNDEAKPKEGIAGTYYIPNCNHHGIDLRSFANVTTDEKTGEKTTSHSGKMELIQYDTDGKFNRLETYDKKSSIVQKRITELNLIINNIKDQLTKENSARDQYELEKNNQGKGEGQKKKDLDKEEGISRLLEANRVAWTTEHSTYKYLGDENADPAIRDELTDLLDKWVNKKDSPQVTFTVYVPIEDNNQTLLMPIMTVGKHPVKVLVKPKKQ